MAHKVLPGGLVGRPPRLSRALPHRLMPGESVDFNLSLSLPYMFTSSTVRQVVDRAGIVHETTEIVEVSEGRRSIYRRATRCESATWHLIEPIFACDEDAVTTCLSCIGARRG
jgi:hypothetical protein